MTNNGIPYINGQLYGWGDVKVSIAGVVVTGITAIEYKEEQEKINVYGSGLYPIGHGSGRISPSASITLLEDEIARLREAAPNGRLQDIAPFDITVTFLSPNTAKIQTHVLKNCRFTDNGVSASEGDTSLSQQLTLVLSSIKWK
jgi:hypothetical protein